MLVNNSAQLKMNTSEYSSLFGILIASDNLFRQIVEAVDFTFVYERLKDKYSSTAGRPAVDVTRMFKLIVLKHAYKISDRALVRRCLTDMEFKFFLGYDPEETRMIDPSLLTKFRRERIGDDGETLLDELLAETVRIAIEAGVMPSRINLIMDSTHTGSMYGALSPREVLIKETKSARKRAYSIDPTARDRMPKKRESTGLLEDEVEYTKELIATLKTDPSLACHPLLRDDLDLLEELVGDVETALAFSVDPDARVGHKTADTAFFGYKTHVGMSPEGIITAAVVTSGEAYDGDRLQTLVEKTEAAGLEVVAVTGDAAYSESDNIEYCNKKNILLASKLSQTVTEGNGGKKRDEFRFNKDAGMYCCPAGHMAARKARQGTSAAVAANGIDTRVTTYYFDVEKCKKCPKSKGCYREGAKSKSFSVKKKSLTHLGQMAFMESEAYKKLLSHRYKIEQKNAELKGRHGYDRAGGVGLGCMTVQAGATLFLVNMKRIFTLVNARKAGSGKE